MNNKKFIILPIIAVSACTLSFGTTFAIYKRSNAEDIEIDIKPSLPVLTGFYLNVFNGSSLVSKTPLVVNPDNNNELMVKNISASKDYKFKISDKNDTYYGQSGFYSHNITANPTLNTFISEKGDYVASQEDQYDFYLKFNSSTYENPTGLHVSYHSIKTVKFHSNWTMKSNFRIFYWGTSSELNWSDFNDAKQMDSLGNETYSATLPSKSDKVIFRFHNSDGEDKDRQTVDVNYEDNATYEFSDWNGGTPTVKKI